MIPRAALLAAVLFLAGASTSAAQEATSWAAHLAAGREALAQGDSGRAVEALEDAARLIPEGHINRPFVQYHLARALALAGRPDEAVRWLGTMWDEGIEGLMLYFAEHDPAFESLRDSEGYRAVLASADALELEVSHLRGAVHLLVGGGSNVVVSVGAEGALLVDTGYGAAAPAVRRALARISGGSRDRSVPGNADPEPGAGARAAEEGSESALPSVAIRWIVNTHAHEDHVGGNEALGAAARILAHPATRQAMTGTSSFIDGVELPPKAASALPDMAVAREVSLEVNGERVRILPLPAHTEGDAVVYFAGSRVLAMGDDYSPSGTHVFPGRTDPVGFVEGLEALLEDLPRNTIVVGGHDPPTDLAPLRGQLERTRDLLELARRGAREDADMEALGRQAERAGLRRDWLTFYVAWFRERGGP